MITDAEFDAKAVPLYGKHGLAFGCIINENGEDVFAFRTHWKGIIQYTRKSAIDSMHDVCEVVDELGYIETRGASKSMCSECNFTMPAGTGSFCSESCADSFEKRVKEHGLTVPPDWKEWETNMNGGKWLR